MADSAAAELAQLPGDLTARQALSSAGQAGPILQLAAQLLTTAQTARAIAALIARAEPGPQPPPVPRAASRAARRAQAAQRQP
jgi:hypothetical protein